MIQTHDIQDAVGPDSGSVTVHPLEEADLSEAKRIFHLAFGTFLGLPDPMQFCHDRDYVRSRYRANPEGALGAKVGDELAGSNFAIRWGSVGFFGPLTIRPDFWGRGVAQSLLEPTVELFEQWQTRHAGLFTFPHSAKHVHLYQKFGFWPSRSVPPLESGSPIAIYSELSASRQSESLKACRDLTDAISEFLFR